MGAEPGTDSASQGSPYPHPNPPPVYRGRESACTGAPIDDLTGVLGLLTAGTPASVAVMA